MKTKTYLECLVLFLISFLSFGQWNNGKTIKGNGMIVTQNRSTTAYEGIKISGVYDVELIAGKEGNISLDGEQNLIDHIAVSVNENILTIGSEKGYYLKTSNNQNIHIKIPIETINQLSLSGSGTIISRDVIRTENFDTKLSGSGELKLLLDTKKLNMTLSGSGSVLLKGIANEITTSISGSGDIDATQLESKAAKIIISGSGNVKVTCSDSLHARISGSGKILYSGNPNQKDTQIYGSGSISKS